MVVNSRARQLCLVLFLQLFFLLSVPLISQAVEKPKISILTIDGIISPFSSRYIVREIQRAYAANGHALILILDTPGGLESSTRDMVQALLNAPLPVIVFVAPSGAHAASAGMFITMAAHLAVMAPGTNIGAAHPVAIGAQEQENDVITSKVVEDVAALARSIAISRKRNAVWAENAVRNSVSITAQEALKANVIDLIARDVPQLLTQLDGKTINLPDRQMLLRTGDVSLFEVPMNLAERVLQAVTNPNIAYLLMTVALIGIIAELYNPGAFFPGITGLVSLVLALSALGSLPLSWAGLTLLVIGMVLLAADLYTEGFGILAGLGLPSFVLGSLFLYQPMTPVSPAFPSVEVDRWLIALVSVLILVFFLFVIRSLLKTRRTPFATGSQLMLGKIGVATSELSPTGSVRIEGEEWSAVYKGENDLDETLAKGSRIQVIDMEGLTLIVGRPQK